MVEILIIDVLRPSKKAFFTSRRVLKINLLVVDTLAKHIYLSFYTIFVDFLSFLIKNYSLLATVWHFSYKLWKNDLIETMLKFMPELQQPTSKIHVKAYNMFASFIIIFAYFSFYMLQLTRPMSRTVCPW